MVIGQGLKANRLYCKLLKSLSETLRAGNTAKTITALFIKNFTIHLYSASSLFLPYQPCNTIPAVEHRPARKFFLQQLSKLSGPLCVMIIGPCQNKGMATVQSLYRLSQISARKDTGVTRQGVYIKQNQIQVSINCQVLKTIIKNQYVGPHLHSPGSRQFTDNSG